MADLWNQNPWNSFFSKLYINIYFSTFCLELLWLFFSFIIFYILIESKFGFIYICFNVFLSILPSIFLGQLTGEPNFYSPTNKVKNDLYEISRAICAFEVTTGKPFKDTSGKELIGRFLRKIPLDPNKIPYSFASAPMELGGCVSSNGPDGIHGNYDDIVIYWNPGGASLTKLHK